jgi:hypothetical protein
MRRFAATVALVLTLSALPTGADAADLFNNTNTGGVANGPTSPTVFVLQSAAQVTELVTYHWNNGRGSPPGTIALRSANGQIYGPYQAHGVSGQNGAADVNWVADVNLVLPPGSYTVVDSDPATWSQNPQSGGHGFAIVRGALAAGTPGPPYPSPAPVAATPANPAPCHYSTGTAVEMLRPNCSGPVGTIITLEVTQPLPARLTGITFAPMQATNPAKPQTAKTPPNNILPFTLPVALGSGTAVGTRFDGTTVGSRYTVIAQGGTPAAPFRLLCAAGRGSWVWDMTYEPHFPGKSYYVDFFVIRC